MAASIASKFTTNVDVIEEKIKAATVGLATLDEIKEKQNEILALAYYFNLFFINNKKLFLVTILLLVKMNF